MTTETEIYSMALDLLEETPMISDTDNRPSIRFMKRNYVPTRDALLRRHPWNFALCRAKLNALSTPPAFGWERRYQAPVDSLRVLPLASLGSFNGRYVPFVVEGREILTNAEAPLRIQYIGKVEDPSQFDAMFVEALAATLATKAASLITGKQSFAERMRGIAMEAVMAAQMVDGLEGTPEAPQDQDWVDGRFEGVIA